MKRALLLSFGFLVPSCSQIHEREISIISKPILTRENGTVWLIASQGNTKVEARWADKEHKAPATLDTGKPYRFDLIQVRRKPWKPWDSSLLRVADADRVLADRSICEIHHIAMRRRGVPIAYGLFRYDPLRIKAEEKLFPHGEQWVGGGCIVGPEKEDRVFQCTSCLEAKKRWDAAHRSE